MRGVEEGEECCAVGLVEVWGQVGAGYGAGPAVDDDAWCRGVGGHGGCCDRW